jgi:hypothetical protein
MGNAVSVLELPGFRLLLLVEVPVSTPRSFAETEAWVQNTSGILSFVGRVPWVKCGEREAWAESESSTRKNFVEEEPGEEPGVKSGYFFRMPNGMALPVYGSHYSRLHGSQSSRCHSLMQCWSIESSLVSSVS